MTSSQPTSIPKIHLVIEWQSPVQSPMDMIETGFDIKG